MKPIIQNKNLLIGGIFILFGGVIIANNAVPEPFFDFWDLVRWQNILILIGIVSLLTSERVTPGIVLITVGLVFLFPDIIRTLSPTVYETFFTGPAFWGLMVVLAGILIIFKSSRGRDYNFVRSTWREHKSADDADMDIIDETSIFGGGERIVTSRNFKGGRLQAIFGGSIIRFKHAELSEGAQVLEVFAMFGGWELHVPSNWNIKIEVTPIFGAVEDRRYTSPDMVEDNTRRLIIRGTVIFGGGEIKTI